MSEVAQTEDANKKRIYRSLRKVRNVSRLIVGTNRSLMIKYNNPIIIRPVEGVLPLEILPYPSDMYYEHLRMDPDSSIWWIKDSGSV